MGMGFMLRRCGGRGRGGAVVASVVEVGMVWEMMVFIGCNGCVWEMREREECIAL
jgi:hypothetical protein